MRSKISARKRAPMSGGATYSFSHRAYRLLWSTVWSLLGVWTPVPAHSWRRSLLRVFGAQVDSTAKVYPGVRVWYPRNLVMSRYATLGPNVNCYCMSTIYLGEYALVSQGAYLCGGTHNIDAAEFELQVGAIYLEAQSWVAAEAFVGPGVNVGHGAVLGARAVAVKDLDAWGVYVGNPARKIRMRTRTSVGDS